MPYMTTGDGIIHYRFEGPAGAPVLLLSNSLGTTLAMWEPQLEAFSEHYRVLRYDTRGHGGSSAPPGPYSIAQLGGDVLCLLDHLDLGRVHMCGLSMGGITAMWLALHHPERIARLVLCNTAAYIGPPANWTERAELVLREGMAPIAQAVVARWLTPEHALAHPEQVTMLQGMLLASWPEAYAANCLAVRDSDLRQQVASIRAPTLVIAGSGDKPTPPSDGRFLAGAIPDCRYLELDAAHLSNQEQPARFNAAVLDFIGAAS